MESIEKCQAAFRQAGQHFTDYFMHLVDQNRNNWPELDAEYANLMTAIRKLRLADDDHNLLTFRDALQPYLDLQGHWADSLMLNEWAIAAAETLGDQISVARFTHDRADILNQMGMYHQAERLYKSSEEDYLVLGESGMALRSRHMRTLVLRAQGHLAEAEQLCETIIMDARHLNMEHWLAHPLFVRAQLALDRGDFRLARLWVKESLDRLANSDEIAMIGQCYQFWGELALLQGDLVEARTELEKSLQSSHKAGILRLVAATQRLLGDLARAERQYDEAERLYCEALAIATHFGDRPQQGRVLLSHAQLVAYLGRRQQAIGLLERARMIYQETGDPRGTTGTLLLLAQLYLQQKQFKLATLLAKSAILTAWKAKLLRPSVLVGVVRRKGKW